jgi:hypothetical protein
MDNTRKSYLYHTHHDTTIAASIAATEIECWAKEIADRLRKRGATSGNELSEQLDREFDELKSRIGLPDRFEFRRE